MAPEARRRGARTLAAALLLGLGTAGAVQVAKAAPAVQAVQGDAQALRAACDGCHGPGGNAVLPGQPSLAGQPRVFLENQLVLIRDGLRDVPTMRAVMAGISDEQVVELARHYAASKPQPRALPLREGDRRAGAELSQRALCGTCHLPDYAGQQQVPRLAGQDETYLRATMKMYRDAPAPGRDTLMQGPLQGMSDAQLGQLAHYLAHYLAALPAR